MRRLLSALLVLGLLALLVTPALAQKGFLPGLGVGEDIAAPSLSLSIHDAPEPGESFTEWAARVHWLRWLISAAIVALALLLLRFGTRRVIGPLLEAPDSEEGGRALSARAALGVSTLWVIGVTLAAAAIIIWPVLGSSATLFDAVSLVDYPLFYIDKSGVSLLSLLKFVVVFYVGVQVSKFLRRLLQNRVYPALAWDAGLTNSLDTILHYSLIVSAGVVGLHVVGVGLSSLAFFAGVLGIGIGFGLRNIVENFISGLIILAERPVKIGDYITIEGEVEGRVESIRARSTTVTTRDNIDIIIPNSHFISGRVTNWSHGDPVVRVHVSVGLAYGSDTQRAREVLLEVAGAHALVLSDPPPEVHFRAFGDNALDFRLYVWIVEQRYRFRIASDLHFAVDAAFREASLEIAFPQRDLHLRSVAPEILAAQSRD